MKKRTFASLIFAVLLWVPVAGQSRVEQLVFDKANQLYLNSDYSAAREEYQKVINSGFESAELYYNLGNTFYKLGQIPSAILYFERALILNPKDVDIQFNLDLVNKLVIDKINPVNEFFIKKWIKAVSGIMPAGSWGLISIVSFAILLLMAVIFYAARDFTFRRLIVPGGAVAGFILFFALILGGIQNKLSAHPDSAIVFTSSLTAKSSPDASGTDLLLIHEGLKVIITDKVGSWIRIRLADGNEAWIPESSVERI